MNRSSRALGLALLWAIGCGIAALLVIGAVPPRLLGVWLPHGPDAWERRVVFTPDTMYTSPSATTDSWYTTQGDSIFLEDGRPWYVFRLYARGDSLVLCFTAEIPGSTGMVEDDCQVHGKAPLGYKPPAG